MFGSSKRDQWGPEGLGAVSKSYQVYLGINRVLRISDFITVGTSCTFPCKSQN